MGDTYDFGELSHDEDLKKRILGFVQSMDEVEKLVKDFCDLPNSKEYLTPQDQVRYELFQAFTVSSLYWFYLRIKGVDPNQHDIRSELNRIRDYMVKSKELYEKQTLMPRINKGVADRFVKHSLWTPEASSSHSQGDSNEDRVSKKIKKEPEDTDNDKS